MRASRQVTGENVGHRRRAIPPALPIKKRTLPALPAEHRQNSKTQPERSQSEGQGFDRRSSTPAKKRTILFGQSAFASRGWLARTLLGQSNFSRDEGSSG